MTDLDPRPGLSRRFAITIAIGLAGWFLAAALLLTIYLIARVAR